MRSESTARMPIVRHTVMTEHTARETAAIVRPSASDVPVGLISAAVTEARKIEAPMAAFISAAAPGRPEATRAGGLAAEMKAQKIDGA